MEQAPATILIVNTPGLGLSAPLTPEERIHEICNYQSIGAAIENMTLEAAKLGLGSLFCVQGTKGMDECRGGTGCRAFHRVWGRDPGSQAQETS